jgi:hypothetical protein
MGMGLPSVVFPAGPVIPTAAATNHCASPNFNGEKRPGAMVMHSCHPNVAAKHLLRLANHQKLNAKSSK